VDGFSSNLLVKNAGEFDAGDGQLVVCRTEVPFRGYSKPMCAVTEVLGDPESPGVDVLAIAKRYQLPMVFPEPVVRESERIPGEIDNETIANRRDIRNMVIFTIDPEDAKDFDDAISITRSENGGFELGVHIADVSYYVGDGSAMDNEAIARGMSCYLVDRVIPMLPERLSNGLCSLNPHEDRVTKSVFVTLDERGTVIRFETANTVINSRMRLNYRQVQDYLDGTKTAETAEITPEVGEALGIFSKLTDVLIERRNERGAIDIELPEAKVILDKNNKPVDIVKRERIKSHRMIEEAMLLANTIVAQKLARAGAPFLYRIHDKPDMKKMEAFGEAANLLGYKFKPSKAKDQRYILDFLLSIRGQSHEKILNMLLLRSLKKAGYSPKNIGHYGLAIEQYAHFTSPIRRYPDLLVHRQLETYIFGNGDGHDERSYTYYETLGNTLTQREIITDSAERDSVKMKAAEFMKSRLGEEFEGTVTGVMPVGLFVELDEYYVEGLVHVSTLHDDYYDMDTSGFALVGARSGRRFMVGDRVLVAVASADKTRGEINFELVKKYKKKK
jgi:ribonuclease R